MSESGNSRKGKVSTKISITKSTEKKKAKKAPQRRMEQNQTGILLTSEDLASSSEENEQVINVVDSSDDESNIRNSADNALSQRDISFIRKQIESTLEGEDATMAFSITALDKVGDRAPAHERNQYSKNSMLKNKVNKYLNKLIELNIPVLQSCQLPSQLMQPLNKWPEIMLVLNDIASIVESVCTSLKMENVTHTVIFNKLAAKLNQRRNNERKK